MELTHEPVRLHVADRIHKVAAKVLGEAGAVSVLDIYKQLVEPPNAQVGDFAFGCFLLAKLLKQAPPMVAKKIEEGLGQDPYIASVKATGPYLNVTLTGKALGEMVLVPILKLESFKRKFTSDNPRTMIEYSQPNTHKELHVGHMRNMCLGHSLVLMLRYAGHDVVASTFPGDQGTHVAKCLWYMKYHNKEAIPSTHKGEWLGRMYSKAHLKLEDENGTPQETVNREQLTQILKQLESKKGEFYD
ncbi:MAG: arginine--tRNA ligase, partial [Bdellovibrionales bacterium]|nr:arginine--tRNA ligase [Bdellovibrionales bacterium]